MSSLSADVESVFRLVDREIWIVTAATGAARGGLTATWVSQASIDASRPLALIGLAPNHHTAELVDESGAFGLHLLTAAQADVAWNFANGSGRDRDKFDSIAIRTGATGSPLLETCLARLECRVFARLETGDRTYYWADVVAGGLEPTLAPDQQQPLTEQQFFRQASDDQRRRLIEGRDQDIALQRPLLETWRRELPELLRGT